MLDSLSEVVTTTGTTQLLLVGSAGQSTCADTSPRRQTRWQGLHHSCLRVM